MREEFIRGLYEQYFGLVYKYCLSKLRHDEDAADETAHAVFDSAAESWEKLREHPNILGWLMLTAKNLIRRRWRDGGRDKLRSIPLELIVSVPDPRDPFDSVELSDKDIAGITEQVLSGLSPAEREIYELFYRSNLPYPDIAEKLGISEAAVRARLARVKAKLMKRIIYFLGER